LNNDGDDADDDDDLTLGRIFVIDLDGGEHVREWTTELHQLLERDGGVRYPTGHNMSIPRETVTRETADEASRLCSNTVDWCSDFISRT